MSDPQQTRSLKVDQSSDKEKAVSPPHNGTSHVNVKTHSLVSADGIIGADELDEVLDEAIIEAAGQGNSASVYLWGLTFFAAIGGLLFGYDTGAISSVLVQIGTDLDGRELSDGDKEFITSALILGATIASLFAGIFADRFGRKWTLVLCDIMFIAGAVIQAAAMHKWTIIPGRFIMGFGVGASAQIVPIYIQELSPTHIRGRLTCINSITVTGGQVLAYAIGAAFENVSAGWRWIIALGAFPPIIQIIGIHFFMPESPRHLVKTGKIHEATHAVSRIYPNATPVQVDAKVDVMRRHIQIQDLALMNKIRMVWTDLPTRRAVFLTSIVLIAQQLSGFNSLMYYSVVIFKSAGLNNPSATGIVISGTNFLFTFIPLKYIDRFGRRRFLLVTMPCVVIFLVATALVFHFMLLSTNQVLQEGYEYPAHLTTLMLLFIVFYVASYATGLGNVPWQQGEFFNTNTRMIGTSISTFSNWAANLIISSTFLRLMRQITPSGAFGFYATLTTIFTIFVYFLYPETSLLSLEQVRTTLDGGFNVKKSLKLRKEKLHLCKHQQEEPDVPPCPAISA